MNEPDAFDGPTRPTRIPAGGWEAEERRLQLQRDTARARAARARWIVITGILAGAALAWWFRWEIVPTHTSGEYGRSSAYAIDHWTGTLYWLAQDERLPVTKP